MRSLNDEENGVLDTWLSLGIPDGSSDDDYEEFAADDKIYNEFCELFARLVSHLIYAGDWNSDGYCVEFYNPDVDLMKTPWHDEKPAEHTTCKTCKYCVETKAEGPYGTRCYCHLNPPSVMDFHICRPSVLPEDRSCKHYEEAK